MRATAGRPGACAILVTVFDRTPLPPFMRFLTTAIVACSVLAVHAGDGGRLAGDAGDDVLYGGDGRDTMTGRFGRDEIFGGAGDDFISSEDGEMVLHGEAGADVFRLRQNVPNPFNPVTEIAFDVPRSGANVTLRIYDVTGHLVRTLASEPFPPGEHALTWNGRDQRGRMVGSGVYLYRMRAGEIDAVEKLLLVK